MKPARVLLVASTAVLSFHACGRLVELETESAPLFDAGLGGGAVILDSAGERITPDGPVPVVEDSGLSLEAGDGCAARPTGCPSTTDFPCGLTPWFTQVVNTCRAQVGCVSGFLTIELAGEGCASQIGMTEVDRGFVACLVSELGGERCPCSPGVQTFYLGPGC